MYETNPLLILLVQIGLILVVARIMGLLFARIGQPQVMGEMIAGIMLGPSLFGWMAPEIWAQVFPAASIPYLNLLSQLGVIFFLFLVGLELDVKLIRSSGRSAVAISNSSIIVPFLLGAGLTFYLYPRVFVDGAPAMTLRSAVLFMGAAMSVTAFPVLARILTERNLHKTPVGAISITSAAVNDAVAWCLLAFVVAAVQAEARDDALWTAFLSAGYILLMLLAVRPFMRRIELVYERQGRLSQNVMAVILLLVLVSALATEAIGIHAMFGAFLAGVIMPKGTRFVRELSVKLEDYTVVFLLPIFFAYAGLNTQIGLLSEPGLWGYTLMIIAVACIGKFGGAAFAARACGIGWRESWAIGTLMNTRGLMELVILNVGLELGVINETVFAMMVIMALVTTFMTTPLLGWIYPAGRFGAEEAEAKLLSEADVYSVLIPVSLPETGRPLLRLARSLVEPDDDIPRIYALHLRRPVDHEAYRAGLEEVEPSRSTTLAPLLNEANAQDVRAEPLSFVSRDIATDIAAVARAKRINMVLMGYHKPVFGGRMLGGTVHHVLTQCPADVGIFVDRGFEQARNILVPYLGGNHDRLALDLAGRIARNAGARVTVLHVVPPGRATGPSPGTRQAVDRVFREPDQPLPVTLQVIASDSPVDVVLQQAKDFDLVLIGVSEEWGLESHLFGWRAERITADSPTSLLLVRKLGAESSPAPAPAPTQPIERA
jgi:Kef-type K+ transport system membrane component KefB/nucleotide-binding universal stress UspA family protein